MGERTIRHPGSVASSPRHLVATSDLLVMAFRDLGVHPLRTGLSVVSLASALAITVVLFAAGSGLTRTVGAILRELGEGQLEVDPGRTTGAGGQRRAGRTIRIRYDELSAVRSSLPSFRAVAPYYNLYGGGASSSRFSIPWSPVRAVSGDYLDARGMPVVEGRWFRQEELDEGAWVAVMNEGLRRMIFRDDVAVGQWVEWRGRRMEVVGVVSDEALFPYILFMPYNTARHISDATWISGIVARPVEGASWDQAIQELRRLLAGLGGFDPNDPNALEIEDNREFTSSVRAGTVAMRLLVLTIAMVSLVLGALGVANMMVISVTERTRDIGLRKALGAAPRDIFIQIVFEALVVTAVGGFVGLAVGAAACWSVGSVRLGDVHSVRLAVDPGVAASSLAALAVVGLVASWVPARRAAALPAAEALRWE